MPRYKISTSKVVYFQIFFGIDNLDLESVSDSGLVSQYTGHSKATRPQFIGINNTTLSGGSESGFTEPGKGAFAAVPSSSPADKV